ncbi:MAG: DNA replication/repair protein RecF [Rickettsiales bacterium]|nr:DNA replication/repair protein RecF [Rickettsiales bacterium]
MNSYIKKLTLTNYRVYENNSFNFTPKINIIYGRNGIGKTNILEAISFLSAGKGFFNSNLNDVLKIEKDNWTIFANIENNDIADTLAVFSENDDGCLKKKIKINGNFVRSQEELSKIFNIIWLTPDMQNIFNDDKSIRRKFLDRIVYLLDNQHSSRVAKYEFLVKERMRVLQDECKFDKKWLSILENKIAEVGISIAVARNDIVRKMNTILSNYDFEFPKFTITLDGFFENLMLEDLKSIEAEQKFKEILSNNREKDKETKRTNEGTHKTDLRLFYQKKNMDAQFCSTGEQKLFLVSLTILKALMCKENKKATPIILLDEVFSYLDKNKKLELFHELLKLNIQSFITGTDVSVFSDCLNNDFDVNFLNLEDFILFLNSTQ